MWVASPSPSPAASFPTTRCRTRSPPSSGSTLRRTQRSDLGQKRHRRTGSRRSRAPATDQKDGILMLLPSIPRPQRPSSSPLLLGPVSAQERWWYFVWLRPVTKGELDRRRWPSSAWVLTSKGNLFSGNGGGRLHCLASDYCCITTIVGGPGVNWQRPVSQLINGSKRVLVAIRHETFNCFSLSATGKSTSFGRSTKNLIGTRNLGWPIWTVSCWPHNSWTTAAFFRSTSNQHDAVKAYELDDVSESTIRARRRIRVCGDVMMWPSTIMAGIHYVYTRSFMICVRPALRFPHVIWMMPFV